MKSLLTAIIPVKTVESARQQIITVAQQVDVLELRLDYLKNPTLDTLQAITCDLTLPYIVTLRSKTQGGFFTGDETQRLNLIESFLTIEPDYLDIEIDVPDEIIAKIHQLSPDTKLIRSFHHFTQTPEDLSIILKDMQHPNIAIYKIVTQANSSLDTLRMMNFVKQHSSKIKLIGHCMGEKGQFSRIAGAVLGNDLTYAAIDDNHHVVDHQLTVTALRDIYYLPKKNQDTQLLALLGDPITHSLGHIFHNKEFEKRSINALYVKIRLQACELTSFFRLVKTLPFVGFSVTMPLKKAILPYVYNVSGIEAVNTLFVTNDAIVAINTDGSGAVDTIEERINIDNKKILILGAGGAATAIAHTAFTRKARITIANRTLENARKIAQRISANVIDFSSTFSESYDIIINTLPLVVFAKNQFIDWLSTLLKQRPIVLDVNYHREQNTFFDLCRLHHCQIIPGEEMFFNQAQEQLLFWFNKK